MNRAMRRMWITLALSASALACEADAVQGSPTSDLQGAALQPADLHGLDPTPDCYTMKPASLRPSVAFDLEQKLIALHQLHELEIAYRVQGARLTLAPLNANPYAERWQNEEQRDRTLIRREGAVTARGPGWGTFIASAVVDADDDRTDRSFSIKGRFSAVAAHVAVDDGHLVFSDRYFATERLMRGCDAERDWSFSVGPDFTDLLTAEESAELGYQAVCWDNATGAAVNRDDCLDVIESTLWMMR